MPAFTIASTIGSTRRPPSSFTAVMPPSFSSRTAFAVALTGSRYEPKGRSPTSSGRLAPRDTALQWCNMSAIVTLTVDSYPSTHMPTESPTRMQSTPALSACRAAG